METASGGLLSRLDTAEERVFELEDTVKVKVAQSCPTPCDPMDYSLWNSPDRNTGVGSLSLHQGIFPTQDPNPGLLHCRQILYHLNQRGRPEDMAKECLKTKKQRKTKKKKKRLSRAAEQPQKV